jgi:hypothetical protein
LTLNPADLDGQQEFFGQLGEALDDPDTWGLLSMREDYMGGLDRFLPEIPGNLRARYRLDFLDLSSARVAIQEPAKEKDFDVVFEDEAADQLIDRLRKVDLQSPGGILTTVDGQYIEPVLLQVVCHRIWRRMTKGGRPLSRISVSDIDVHGDIDRALRKFYAEVVKDVASNDINVEASIRRWFDLALITRAGFRSQTTSLPDVPDAEKLVGELLNRYILRFEDRKARWYELTHDRMVRPVREDNASWRRKNLGGWQASYWDWTLRNDDAFLLRGDNLHLGRQAVSRMKPAAQDEELVRFIDESERRVREERRKRTLLNTVGTMGLFLSLSVLVNIVLLLLLLGG